MGRLFTGVRAPSTLGTFLRSFTFGHVRQLDAVASRLLVNLVGHTPLLPGADELTYVDVDDTVRATYGYAKQGAGRGYTGVKGLNVLIAIVSTPTGAPVIAAARLRKGSTNSAKGAARFVADALVTAGKAGGTGVRVADRPARPASAPAPGPRTTPGWGHRSGRWSRDRLASTGCPSAQVESLSRQDRFSCTRRAFRLYGAPVTPTATVDPGLNIPVMPNAA
jgi:hypothetical protein